MSKPFDNRIYTVRIPCSLVLRIELYHSYEATVWMDIKNVTSHPRRASLLTSY